MKSRTPGFLSEENISHESEIFDYVAELHGYLWRFVRAGFPEANGDSISRLQKGTKMEDPLFDEKDVIAITIAQTIIFSVLGIVLVVLFS